MACGFIFYLVLLSTVVSICFSESVIRLARDGNSEADDRLYCNSWMLSVETNNAGRWEKIPIRCEDYVWEYTMTGQRYLSDSQVVANFSRAFAATIKFSGDGKEAWVLDIDDTLLSHAASFWELHGSGTKSFNEMSFAPWYEAPALPASLSLYNELKQLGFKLFLMTGRPESMRDITARNLLLSGYSGWDRLILRGPLDEDKPAIQYKSEKRLELINEGYRIEGNCGDQWSDLLGFAVATRSFKLPNPMYNMP